MNKQTTFYKFGHRDQGYLSDKYIRELHNEVPFDIELVGSNNKKVKAHRFVVMMFSKYFRNLFKDGGNSYQNGMVIGKLDFILCKSIMILTYLFFRSTHFWFFASIFGKTYRTALSMSSVRTQFDGSTFFEAIANITN